MINYQNKEQKIVGVVLASITIFIWGITFICTKYLLKTFSALEILIVRFLFAYIGLWILSRKTLTLKEKKDELLFIAAGLFGVTVYQFLENIAINFTSANNVSIIVSICPMFTAIIAQIFLKEKHITPTFCIGFLVAMAGIVLVTFNGTIALHLSPKGDLLAFLAALSWGFYSLFLSKINSKGYTSLAATRRIFFWALIFMIPLSLFGKLAGHGISITEDVGSLVSSSGASIGERLSSTFICLNPAVNKFRWSNIMNWVNLLFLGLGASAFCFAAWNKACLYIGTVKATLGIYLIPVVTIIFSFIFLHDKLTLMGTIGALLTISGLFISEIKLGKKSDKL